MKYTFEAFFYEVRVLLSLIAVLYLFYRIRVVDDILKTFIVDYLTHKIKLPVSIAQLRLKLFEGVLTVHGFKILVPEEDLRWQQRCMVYVRTTLVTFHPFTFFASFLRAVLCQFVADMALSSENAGGDSDRSERKDGEEEEDILVCRGILLSIESMRLTSVQVNIEGYKEKAGTENVPGINSIASKTFINLKLFGKKKKRKRERKPTQREIREREALMDRKSFMGSFSKSSLLGLVAAPAPGARVKMREVADESLRERDPKPFTTTNTTTIILDQSSDGSNNSNSPSKMAAKSGGRDGNSIVDHAPSTPVKGLLVASSAQNRAHSSSLESRSDRMGNSAAATETTANNSSNNNIKKKKSPSFTSFLFGSGIDNKNKSKSNNNNIINNNSNNSDLSKLRTGIPIVDNLARSVRRASAPAVAQIMHAFVNSDDSRDSSIVNSINKDSRSSSNNSIRRNEGDLRTEEDRKEQKQYNGCDDDGSGDVLGGVPQSGVYSDGRRSLFSDDNAGELQPQEQQQEDEDEDYAVYSLAEDAKKVYPELNKDKGHKKKVNHLDALFSKASSLVRDSVKVIDSAYKKARTTIERKINSSIDQVIVELHERFRGGEPIPMEDDLLVRVKTISVNDIVISMRNALPSALRHLERKPLVVNRVSLTCQGFSKREKNAASEPTIALAPTDPLSSNISSSSSTSSSLSCALNEVFENEECAVFDANVSIDEDHFATTSHPSTECNEISAQLITNSKVEDFEGKEPESLSSVLDLDVSDGRHEYIAEEPVPAIIIQYRLEREIITRMMKANAGRVLRDAWTDWGKNGDDD